MRVRRRGGGIRAYYVALLKFWSLRKSKHNGRNCSVRRSGRGQGEGIENVLHWQNHVLPPVELVGHRRSGHASTGVQVPQRRARGGIQSQQIAGIIGAEEEMAGGGK